MALLPVILTSGLPRERVGELSIGVCYMPKLWQPPTHPLPRPIA